MSMRPSRATALLAAPLTAVTVLFLAPLALMVAESVSADRTGRRGVTLEHYVRVFSDPYYTGSLALTLGTALVVAATTIAVAYPVAFLYWRAGRRARTLMFALLLTPFYVDSVVKVFGWMLLLAPGGLINNALVQTGLLETPLDLLNGWPAIAVVSVHRCLPFVVLLVATALAGIDDEVLASARLCGASGSRVLRTIVIPLSMPGVVASAIVTFSLTAAGFVIPRLVGGATGAQFVPVVMYRQIAVTQNWALGAAIGVVLLVLSAVTVAAGARLAQSATMGRVLSATFVR
jgi:putative spermidine/putrescine transport system permease protein